MAERRRSPRRSVGSRSAARAPSQSASSAASSASRARRGVTSRPASSEQSGRSSWRTRLRRIDGSRFEGSSNGSSPARRTTSCASLRRSASSGCSCPGLIAPRPSGPVPRSSRRSTVSAWSSIVCPVGCSWGKDRSSRDCEPWPRGSGPARLLHEVNGNQLRAVERPARHVPPRGVSRGAARGPRELPSPCNRRRLRAPAMRANRPRRKPRTRAGSPAAGRCSGREAAAPPRRGSPCDELRTVHPVDP